MENKIRFKKTLIGEIPEDEELEGFVNAVRKFIDKEGFLIENNLNERTITHKLAEYLQREYPEYNVDCEYNRMPSGVIDEKYIKKALDLEAELIKSDDTGATTVFPDIVVHKRGINEHNFLVIEAKKKENASNREHDFKKLKAFTKELKYKYGIYLEFNKKGVSDMLFFKNGTRMEEMSSEWKT